MRGQMVAQALQHGLFFIGEGDASGGAVLIDLETGDVQRFRWPDGVYGSEGPVAPRVGASGRVTTRFASERARSSSWRSVRAR